MGLRSVLSGSPVTELTEPVDPRFELAALSVQDESQPLVFDSVAGYPDLSAVTNVVSSRERIAGALDVDRGEIVDAMTRATTDPVPLDGTTAATFEYVATSPTVDDHVPIPTYYDEHERQYIASGIVIAKDPDTGVQNLSFHRLMYDGENEFVMRLVERHLHDIRSRTDGPLDVAIVVGVHPAVELAAATSGSPEMDELEVANALLDGDLAVTKLDGLTVPAEAELVMTATIRDETRAEGPFVDLSRTWDTVRQQPVVEVRDLYLRPDPMIRVVVPGKREHAHLMGLPQEPRIKRIVENTVPTVQEVVLTPGGCSWLHGVVSIEKRTEGDAKNAGLAALAAHPSMKRVVVVDEDIDPADPDAVEWAVATRVQADQDIETVENAKGSSLDPSQDFETGTLTKWLVDATVPSNRDRAEFTEATVPGAAEISLAEYQ
ncbi:UbiD family decarboxylase [Halodesulfurarchaeum formicicum]|uniref:Anhydromevalonate phosphate decarboxylase n=1 Tax=Halodesulfurarchaeum formicicum TaxID=1873524 RepID=A0A1J1ACM5_9EURY|nr:UbiD family decarboxylase [Halodesulfurarchaeum formicicum]APE95523.1 UbiD family decarboxylase [Halodesulfurarchaeum formicicum]